MSVPSEKQLVQKASLGYRFKDDPVYEKTPWRKGGQ